ncbi:MAG: cupin domain-containing protein [Phycisphaerales bacterium]
MTTAPSQAARFVSYNEGEVHPVMGDPMRFLATAADTGGAFALAEQRVRPGNGAPPHIHHQEDESFFVLEGEFVVTVNGEERRVGPGDFAHVRRGAVRSFTNAGNSEGRLLIQHTPGAASEFYIGMGKMPFPPDLTEVKALGDRYGIELVFPNG